MKRISRERKILRQWRRTEKLLAKRRSKEGKPLNGGVGASPPAESPYLNMDRREKSCPSASCEAISEQERGKFIDKATQEAFSGLPEL